MDVDDTDRQLLAALAADGRATTNELSRETGISPPVVQQRVHELENRDVVTAYEARVDYDALGFDVTAVVQLTAADAKRAAVLEELRAADQFVTVYEVTGEYDVVAVGRFRDTADLNERVGELVTTDGVADVTTAVVLDTVANDPLSPVRGD
jgi:DNA-binding Lrp family transcriptional regulator